MWSPFDDQMQRKAAQQQDESRLHSVLALEPKANVFAERLLRPGATLSIERNDNMISLWSTWFADDQDHCAIASVLWQR